MPVLREVTVGGEVAGWERTGFDVRDGRITLSGLALRVDAAAEHPVAGLGFSGLGEERDLDGVPCHPVEDQSVVPAAHPNGVTALDHVVVLTRDLDATTSAFVRLGLEPRRTRDVPGSVPAQRQVFFVLGPAVAEVVGPVEGRGDTGSARLWGLAFVAPDLEDTVAALGRLAGPVRNAVQPGRRIATLHHRSARIPVPTVLLSPRP